MARRDGADEDPVGRRITVEGMHGDPAGAVWRTIVGVVGHVKHYGLASEGRIELYVPLLQPPEHFNVGRPDMNLVVRTTGDASQITSAVIGQVRSINRDQPVA